MLPACHKAGEHAAAPAGNKTGMSTTQLICGTDNSPRWTMAAFLPAAEQYSASLANPRLLKTTQQLGAAQQLKELCQLHFSQHKADEPEAPQAQHKKRSLCRKTATKSASAMDGITTAVSLTHNWTGQSPVIPQGPSVARPNIAPQFSSSDHSKIAAHPLSLGSSLFFTLSHWCLPHLPLLLLLSALLKFSSCFSCSGCCPFLDTTEVL